MAKRILSRSLLVLTSVALVAVPPAPCARATEAPSFLSLIPSRLSPVDPGWRTDRDLQTDLQAAVRNLGVEPLIQAGRLGIALVDLSSSAPRLATINGDTMMYAASVPKIAVLYAAFQAMRDGRLRIDAPFHEVLTEMIRVSSNEAASEAIQRVGFDYINSLLWQTGLYDPAAGGLWVGKAYGGVNDSWHRDPLFNISHGATPVALARLLTLLAEGRLVDAEASSEMKEILGDPGIHHKFVRGLEEARPGSQIFRKSGTWHQWHGDAALIERGNKRYVAVALCEDERGGALLERLIVALDDCVCAPSHVATLAQR